MPCRSSFIPQAIYSRFVMLSRQILTTREGSIFPRNCWSIVVKVAGNRRILKVVEIAVRKKKVKVSVSASTESSYVVYSESCESSKKLKLLLLTENTKGCEHVNIKRDENKCQLMSNRWKQLNSWQCQLTKRSWIVIWRVSKESSWRVKNDCGWDDIWHVSSNNRCKDGCAEDSSSVCVLSRSESG